MRRDLLEEEVNADGYVDLGLPSGLLWAKGNIVSNGSGGYVIGEETDYGGYFSWGNVTPHFSTNGRTFDDGYDFGANSSGPYASTPGASLTGDISSYDIEHDAALALLGSAWHMPSEDNFQELYDNTDNEWTTINGVAGYKFMKRTDYSVYVFFPAAGVCINTAPVNRGAVGAYWSRSRCPNINNAYYMAFSISSTPNFGGNPRYCGESVRAIQFPYTITLNFKDSNNNNLVDENLTVTTPNGNVTVTTNSNGNATFITVAGLHSVSSKNYQIATSTFTVTGNATVNLVAGGGNYVDLGLPSGKLWAAGNLVKNNDAYSIGSQTDWGTYVSWGNIDGHNEGEGYDFSSSNYQSTSGYSVSADIPSNDTAHDIALATLGSPWHMPTKEDYQELYDNADREWTTINGIKGLKFMKKSDHSVFVFFPAAGYGLGTSVNNVGSYGYYWSSSWYTANNAYNMRFNSSSVYPQSYDNRYVGFSVRPVLSYLSTNITITLHSTDNSSVNGVVLKVTDSKGVAHTALTDSNGVAKVLDVAYGSATVTSADYGFTPNPITVSASSKSFTLDSTFIQYAYIKIDLTKSNEQQIITVSATENGSKLTWDSTTGRHANAALQALRDASHLYMGKYGNGSMALRQLKDNDGTKYADDNSDANMDGTDGDHYLRIGVPFFIKRVSGSDSGNQVTYCLAVGGQPEGTGWKQIISPNDLLGVHEATATNTGNNTSGTLRSISGGQSTSAISQANFKQKARNGGTGFSLVTWEWHCMMAFLFYAWYGRTNAQAQCGTGADSYTRTLGTKDSLGMTDTDSTNGNTDNTKFWGIENWWGCKHEWIDNVVVDARVWKVTDKNGTQRTAGTGASTNNCIQKMLLSENLDMIPTAVVSDSNYTTYYCDMYSQSSSSSRVVLRSGNDAYADDGIAYVDAYNASSSSFGNRGSRLAYTGPIEIV